MISLAISGTVPSRNFVRTRGGISWRARPCSSATTAARKSPTARPRRCASPISDARRGAKQADLCDDCAGIARTPARRGRGRRPPRLAELASGGSPVRTTAVAVDGRRRTTPRPGPSPLGTTRAAVTFRALCRNRRARRAGAVGRPLYDGRMPLTLLAGPGERGQGRAPARALPGRARARAGSDRAEPVGRRRASSASSCAAAGAPRRVDRHLRRRSSSGSRAGAEERPVATPSQRALVVRRAIAGAPLNGLGRSARFARLRRRAAAGARGARGRACSTRPSSTATSRALHGAYREELDRLGLARPRPRQRAPRVERLDVRPRRLARRARLRLRLRGPDRRGVAPARGARRPHRGHRLAAVRARAAPRSPRSRAPPTTSPRSPAGGSRSCRRASTRSRTRRSPTSSAASSPRRAAAGRRRSTAPSASSRARARAARSSCVGEEVLALLRAGRRPERDRASSARASSAGARRSRPRFGALGVPLRGRGRDRASRATPFGQRAARARSASPGSAAAGATSSRTCARRTRARPRRPSTSLEGRLRGRAVARPRARARGDRAAARRSRCRGWPSCAAPTTRVAAVRERATAMLRAAHGLDSPPATDEVRARPARATSRSLQLLDELDALARARRRASRARTSPPRSSGTRSASRPTSAGRVAVARPAARPHAPLRLRLRARPRGGEPAAPRRRHAVPRRRRAAATSTRAAPGCCAPTRSAATATSSTPPAPAPRSG